MCKMKIEAFLVIHLVILLSRNVNIEATKLEKEIIITGENDNGQDLEQLKEKMIDSTDASLNFYGNSDTSMSSDGATTLLNSVYLQRDVSSLFESRTIPIGKPQSSSTFELSSELLKTLQDRKTSDYDGDSTTEYFTEATEEEQTTDSSTSEASK